MNAGIPAKGTRENFSFGCEKYAEKLKKQAIHMDQGVCYNPEYLATRLTSLYPSRAAQIALAVLRGGLEPSERGAEIIFTSILSGQGERWQNFGEERNDFLHCMILARELFVKSGFSRVKSAEELEIPKSPDRRDLWDDAIKIERGADCFLFVDDASFEYTGTSPQKLGGFLRRKGISLRGWLTSGTGFALMAHGFAGEGADRLRSLIEELASQGAERVVTVSGQAAYCLTVLADDLGIQRGFDVTDVLDAASGIETQRAHIYGGSFYTRFLGKSRRIEALSRNTREIPIPNAPEFRPLYDADRRLNGVGVWESPISSEYVNRHTDRDILDKIRGAALKEITFTPYDQLVICEPFAYSELRRIGYGAGKLAYFWDLLV
ncbi:MAG: hypothetical protein LBR87_01445 [Synergistaceae bacterium]|jgi:hypothetical protein|nr:hypothetical protein [Synergistaceae bacterium]